MHFSALFCFFLFFFHVLCLTYHLSFCFRKKIWFLFFTELKKHDSIYASIHPRLQSYTPEFCLALVEMSVAAGSMFKWLDLLEKEFDRSFVQLDLLLGDIDPEQEDLTNDGMNTF